MKFRIAFAITELDQGGAEKIMTELACRIDRNRFDPSVFVLSDPPSDPILLRKLESHRVPVHFLGLQRWWQLPLVLFRFLRMLRQVKPHLVQSFLFHANIASRIAARVAGVPIVVSGLRVAERAARWHLLVDCMTSGYVDRYVCVSHAVAEFAKRNGLPAEKMEVIPNAIDATQFSWQDSPHDLLNSTLQKSDVPTGTTQQDQEPRPAVAAEHFQLVTVARLDYQKGLDWLLLALADWFHRLSDLRLTIVGDGPMKSMLQRLIAEHRLSEFVTLAGFQKDVESILRKADLFLLPSRWEGMPNALLEAMAAGLPVVATDVEGVREILSPYFDHQCIPVEDTCALGDAILWHYLHRKDSREIGRRNREHVLAKFAWPNAVKQYENLWIGLISRG
ncbi:MAG: glycosyltransferase [Thermogutta sp.]